MPGWKGYGEILDSSMKSICEIHGDVVFWRVQKDGYICSECMMEIMDKMSIDPGQIQLYKDDGIYRAPGIPPEKWDELEQDHMDEYHTKLAAKSTRYPHPNYPHPSCPTAYPTGKLLCKVCGKLMTIDKEEDIAKCGNLMCDSFNIPIVVRQVE